MAVRDLVGGTQATYKNNVTTIFFVRFYNGKNLNILLFTLLLMMYIVTICGHLLIIPLLAYSKTLHSPMYFFPSQLSINDIILTTDIAPNMLNILLHDQTFIYFSSCIAQFYFFCFSETFECLLLMVMSYDRYLAICSPLHYASIMNHALCIKFILATWSLNCLVGFIVTHGMCQLQFCGPNTIHHFYCDLNPLMELSCSDVSIIEMEATLLCIPVLAFPLCVIVGSYTRVVLAILKISSVSGRQKSFSTCSSHLTVVFIFYGTLIAMYALPNEGQLDHISKILALLYTVFTPFLNPFIYSLRNKDIKEALRLAVYHFGAYLQCF
ncbi:PREDICTED: olfactory receptor 11L1-like [Nanorana parkeri]|uniref:olfactory receptor 11L1-like n=1 Tax=Nanorana parkeri TaxID=125878 RepID=UPI00085507E6|nr:PREDICTED: olfactory receptor 11L1-like [Nanorana parkeri]